MGKFVQWLERREEKSLVPGECDYCGKKFAGPGCFCPDHNSMRKRNQSNWSDWGDENISRRRKYSAGTAEKTFHGKKHND
jgi:hypothetical protein